MTEKKEEEKRSYTKELFLTLISGFFKNVGVNWLGAVTEKAQETGARIEKKFIGTLLITAGGILVCVGVAKFVESIIVVQGAGYIIVGVIVALLGFLIKLK
ncbi:MAG: hypothetical protein V1652_02985 [bacterium]